MDEQDHEGRTAAMVAVWRGQYEVLEYLVNSGARLNLQDHQGRSVLHWAVLNRSQQSIKILRYLCQRNLDVLQRDRHGHTCLHRCAEYGFTEGALLLISEFPRLCVVKDK